MTGRVGPSTERSEVSERATASLSRSSTERVLCALTLGLLAACGVTRPPDVVVFASGSDLESANPLVTIHPLARQVQRHVLFVTLVRYDSGLAVEPYFARTWRWSGDRRQLAVHLTSGLRWHDGRPTTATDVAFTLQAARDGRTGFARAADLASVDTVVVTSDTSLLLRFSVPQREVPAILAELPIVPAHLLGDTPRAEMRRAPFNVQPVGNGPFRFVSRVPGQRWTFERNADFPSAMGGPPNIRQLVIAIVDEATTKFAGLAAGDLDFAGIAPTMASLAKRDPAIEVIDYPVLFTNALVLNTHRPPFDDLRVRRAVDLAIDRGRIIDAALAGYATPAAGPVPPENPLAMTAEAAAVVGANVVVADSLLDAAGHPRGKGGSRGIAVELLTVGSGDNAVEQLIQADLGARGIRVEIRQLELAAFLARARAREKDFDLLVTGVPGDLSLAYLRAMFESAHGGGSLDYAGYRSPALDALFARASAATDERSLRSAWHDLQRQLAAEIPVVWLYHSRGVQGVAARMRNVTMDLRGELTTVSRWSVAGAANSALVARGH
jgi:peptide/nickel transport system substrate-binding protein